MPIEKAPYLNYSEQVSTVNYDLSGGADVLAIIAPTKFAKVTETGTIETKTLYNLKISSDSEGATVVANCVCEEVDDDSETHRKLKVIESDATSTVAVNTNFYVVINAKTDESVVYELFTTVGNTNTSANKYAKLSTNIVTNWYEPTGSDSEILVFNKYSVAEERVESEELKKVLKEFFLENSYYSQTNNLGVNAVIVVPIPSTNATNNDVLNAYKLLRKYRRITAIGCVGIGESANLSDLGVALKTYLNEDQTQGNLKIIYIQAPKRDTTNSETITAYATRIATLNQINSSRIAFIEPTHYGTLLAQICNTEYYIEPGYLPINSLQVGEFEVLSNEERDKLCMSGLIFGEDDILLPTTVPRICLGVSSSFGRLYSATAEGYETRPADALLHARRNVDHHVREVLTILAQQIKRNETSVTLRYVKNEVMSYFESELNKGTIQEYSFNVVESSYNPYCLLVTGKLVPVNSTLAIDFNNRIEAPYMVASDYV